MPLGSAVGLFLHVVHYHRHVGSVVDLLTVDLEFNEAECDGSVGIAGISLGILHYFVVGRSPHVMPVFQTRENGVASAPCLIGCLYAGYLLRETECSEYIVAIPLSPYERTCSLQLPYAFGTGRGILDMLRIRIYESFRPVIIGRVNAVDAD